MFTKIEIKEAITQEEIKPGYYVEVQHYYGDADGNESQMVGPFYKGEENYLLSFCNMLEDCLKAYPTGRGGGENYEDKLPEYATWAYLEFWNDDFLLNGEVASDDDMEVIERVGFEAIMDPTMTCFVHEATICSYEVKYYDGSTYREVVLS